MRRIAILALCLGLLSAPALAQSKAAIQKLNDQWAAAFNKGDAAAVAAMDFSAAPIDEFHDWYDLEHIPERLAIPGFLNAERWIGIDNPKISLATYDLAEVGVLHSPPYKAVGGDNASPWTKRTAKFRK